MICQWWKGIPEGHDMTDDQVYMQLMRGTLLQTEYQMTNGHCPYDLLLLCGGYFWLIGYSLSSGTQDQMML